MINKKTWNQFKDSGLLWWTNTLLHTFGWAIVYEFDDNKNISNVYPARVKFRGFDEKSNTEGYIKISKYINDNSKELLEESES
ncbi:hypothetical protein FDF26_14680 [Clostridium botulinum]|nr:hypothetical protein [Clostridium botulinum]